MSSCRLTRLGSDICTKQLLTLVFHCDVFRVGVVIQPSPSGATVTRARRSCVSPDPAVLMALVKAIARGHDFARIRIVVQPLPAWATIPAARGAGITPDPAIVM